MIMANARASLSARLLATHLVFFGAAAMNVTWAEDSAPASNQRDALPHGPGGGQQKSGNSNSESAADGGTTDVYFTGTGGQSAKGDPGTKGSGDIGHEERVDAKESNSEPGDAHLGAKHTGFQVNPIDTNMSVQGSFNSRRVLNTHNWKKREMTRRSGIPAEHRRTLARANKDGVVRNAIGEPVHQTGANVKGTDVKASERAGVDGTPKNINLVGNGGAEAVGTDFHRQGFVPLRASGATPHDSPINTAMNHSIINGRDMVRPGSGTSRIGGAAKNNSGVISGTSFQPRHL